MKNEAIVQSQAVSLRNLENQIRQLAIALSSRPQGCLPSNTEDPRREGKEHYKVINLRSEKNVDNHVGMSRKKLDPISSQEEFQVEMELQQANDQDNIESYQAAATLEKNPSIPAEVDAATPVVTTHSQPKEQHVPPVIVQQFRHPPYFLQRFPKQRQDKQFGIFLEALKQLNINIPFVEALEQMSNYVKFLKDILARKRKLGEFETVALTQECSHMLQSKIPQKLQDP